METGCDLETGLHGHCGDCYSFVLCDRDHDTFRNSCGFQQCEWKCGAVFHQCKKGQHQEVCPNVEEPCLNAWIGCPEVMPRHKRGAHLEHCCASVVSCMAEWNRWPVYHGAKHAKFPFKNRNPYAHEGQLDYDLTLRDQRAIARLGQASRRTRLALRNPLTRRYPALPLPRESLVEKTETDDPEPSCFMDVGDDVEFIGVLQRETKFSKQVREWQEDLDKRLEGKERPPHYWEFPDLERGNLHGHCAYCFDLSCPRDFTYKDDPKERACAVVNCKFECGARHHSCKSSEHAMICPKFEEPNEHYWMLRGMASMEGKRNASLKKLEEQKLKEAKAVAAAKHHEDKVFEGPGKPATVRTILDPVSRKRVPVPPPMPKSLHKSCRLDMRIETVTRLQTKSKHMYTFVCGQDMRRDEYSSHTKNIHSDIVGGLNNWLEQRCPLAYLGCGYTHRRMYPHNQNFTVKFSPAVESFGVTLRTPITSKKQQQPKTKKKRASVELLDLPVEVLLLILNELDSFSLSNMAVTSKYLRHLCCDMLERKGCVTLQWERHKQDGIVKWDVAFKRWFFSNAISPIDRWSFSDTAAMSKHLQSCPYNVKKPLSKPTGKSREMFNKVLSELTARLDIVTGPDYVKTMSEVWFPGMSCSGSPIMIEFLPNGDFKML